jgi:hypothetical protein
LVVLVNVTNGNLVNHDARLGVFLMKTITHTRLPQFKS